MSEPRRDSKWWGWGDPAIAPELDAEALAVLRERIGELEPWPLAAGLEDSAPAPSRCRRRGPRPSARERVFDSHEDRLRHAGGRGYADLVRMRGGAPRGGARRGRATRPTPSRCAGSSTSAPPRASRSCPSAAAPASSAASSRCAAPISG